MSDANDDEIDDEIERVRRAGISTEQAKTILAIAYGHIGICVEVAIEVNAHL
jgi:hypothetical protein